MQDQSDQSIPATAGALPPELLAEMAQSDVMIFISLDGSAMTVRGTFKGDEYKPETIPTHAYLSAVYAEHEYLMDIVNGNITDSDRYRALRGFAGLAGGDPKRFETVNVMLQKFEEENGLANESTTRTPDDFNKIANFLVHALLDTAAVASVAQAGTDTPQ